MWALGHAITTLKHHRDDFRALQKRGMERNSSWDLAAQQYEQVFEWALVSELWGPWLDFLFSRRLQASPQGLHPNLCRSTLLTASKRGHGHVVGLPSGTSGGAAAGLSSNRSIIHGRLLDDSFKEGQFSTRAPLGGMWIDY